MLAGPDPDGLLESASESQPKAGQLLGPRLDLYQEGITHQTAAITAAAASAEGWIGNIALPKVQTAHLPHPCLLACMAFML